MADTSEDETEVGVLIAAKDSALRPFHYAVSKPAQRAYLTTLLFVFVGLFLLGTAVTAYVLFYYAYIPVRGFSRPIYLQFGPDHHPYGRVSLPKELVSNQRYDVNVVLHMPRTPSNTRAGNFMLDLQLLAPTNPGNGASNMESEILVREKRPAIMTYHSQTMEHVHRAAALPLYVIGLRQESEELEVKMMESVEFAKGWRNIPTSARLVLQSEERLQVYSTKVVFTARLRGLRYLMYNYRTMSFLALTGLFWVVEISFTAIAWLALSVFIFPERLSGDGTQAKEEESTSVKQERKTKEDSEGMSDTSHTFPTLTGQPPLRYSSARVKKEEEEQETPQGEGQTFTGEADDEEDEDADFVLDDGGPPGRGVSDSGIGTSLESSAGRHESMRRRTSRMLGDQ